MTSLKLSKVFIFGWTFFFFLSLLLLYKGDYASTTTAYIKEIVFPHYVSNRSSRIESSQQDESRVLSEPLLCMKTSSCPNIVYLLVDDLGYGDVGYNGGKALTPHLNAMAKGPHSIHLTRLYAGGPVCSPTRGTILTGRNHNRYCIWHADIGYSQYDLT